MLGKHQCGTSDNCCFSSISWRSVRNPANTPPPAVCSWEIVGAQVSTKESTTSSMHGNNLMYQLTQLHSKIQLVYNYICTFFGLRIIVTTLFSPIQQLPVPRYSIFGPGSECLASACIHTEGWRCVCDAAHPWMSTPSQEPQCAQHLLMLSNEQLSSLLHLQLDKLAMLVLVEERTVCAEYAGCFYRGYKDS